MEKKTKALIKDYSKTIAFAVLLALFVRTFVVQAFRIPSGSMEPTLMVGDFILVNKFVYGIKIPYTNTVLLQLKTPQRGDVIVFLFPVDPSKDFIKRVIGTEGEKVQLIHGKIYINDTEIDDPWGYFKDEGSPAFIHTVENFGPVTVPPNALFVMGDNRNNSEDSRFWGFLPMDDVIGKAFMIYFSWNSKAEAPWYNVRWSRIGSLIH